MKRQQELTVSQKYEGGNMALTLENNDEPYLEGVKFYAHPPLKRFRDMESLSGGEKTVAALALLFALHSFRPAPFFVLDEIDDHLDKTNVFKVARYIRSKTMGAGQDFQCIVISLKDSFYENAESLVGVYRDRATDRSRTLTVDLEQFGDVPAQ